jgi:lipopolysaccharide assembly outer membrane protein LptD (OstA)
MKVRCRLSVMLLLLALPFVCQSQQSAPPVIGGVNTNSEWESVGNTNYFRNGGMVSNATGMITFDKAAENEMTGEIVAEGDVTILDHGHIWRGTNFIYNFNTGAVRADTFKSVQEPFVLAGSHMTATSNNVYTATNAIVSTDDYARPAYRIHAKTIIISPGEYFEAHHATLYWGNTPVFYFPYYRRSLGQHPNNWEFVPGYRSIYGPYLLSAYNWYGNGMVDGTLHFDLREERGVAAGPDLYFHMGDWGEAAFRYYYADDQNPNVDGLTAPHVGENRQRMSFYYEAHPTTNLTAKVVLDYQSDPLFMRDFFEGEYQTNVEPASFVEATQLWPNYTLDTMVQPRLIDYQETVERLPDIKLSGAREEVGDSPLFYENESSVGYFKRAFSNTNSLYFLTNYTMNPDNMFVMNRSTNLPPSDYSATRFDTFHQFTMPETFFGWLNVTPNVGGRLTWYSDVNGPQAQTNQQTRGVFNTGVDVSFKASQVFRDAENSFLDVHELRHIVEPDIAYEYVPAPSRSPGQIPQFDYQSPSLRLLPIDFPDYNDIDSIGRMNVVRLMLRNRLQTKRDDAVQDLVNWAIYTDWNLDPTNHPFSDLYNDFSFRPRTWLTLNTSVRYDMASNRWREANEQLIFTPSTTWSLSLGYYYLLNNDPEFQTYAGENLPGHSLFSISAYYRLNENWGAHIAEQYEAQYGGLQQQLYSIYRDMRSWTAAVVFRITEGPAQPNDFTVAVTFSLKAFPRFGLGSDNDRQGSIYGNEALMATTPY